MNYQEARKHLRTGDVIGFVHGYFPVGKVVQWVTRSLYTHVAVVIRENDRVLVVEAKQPYVRIFPASRLTPFYWCALRGDLNQDAKNFAYSIVGDRYSLADCYRSVTGETTDDNRWQCAELVRTVHRKNGADARCKATPADIMKWAGSFSKTIFVE